MKWLLRWVPVPAYMLHSAMTENDRKEKRILELEAALKRLLWLHDDDLHGTTPVASETEWNEAWETASELFKEPPR